MHSRNSYIRGPCDIWSFFVKKLCFSFFLLISIAGKDSRFNSGQFHLMVPVSFPFSIQIWGTVGFFSTRAFFHGHWKLTGQQGKGGDRLLFPSTTSTRSRTLSHLFATFHVRWLSHTFNRTACIYQTATRWDLPPYRITIWLIDDVMLVSVCLLEDLILGFCYSNLRRENGRLELASTITLVFQANRLTECASQLRSKQYFSISEFFRVTVLFSFRQL